MKDREIILGAMTGLTILGVVALLKGFNGTLMMFVGAAIAGLAGWAMPQPQRFKE